MANAQIENIRHADNFINIIKDKDHREQLTQNTPELANAIAHYKKDEQETLSNDNIKPDDKKKILESMQGIYAYHIKEHGPAYYAPLPEAALPANNPGKGHVTDADLANNYLNNIHDPAKRVAFKKEHQDLIIPIEAYEFVSNGLGAMQISKAKSEKALNALAEHYADRIREHDADPLAPKDNVYAAVFLNNERTKRNQESAKYFHDNIDTLVFATNQLPPESHKELIGAYYQYQHAVNARPENKDVIKEAMTEQIRTNSPEFFSISANHQEKEPELAH